LGKRGFVDLIKALYGLAYSLCAQRRDGWFLLTWASFSARTGAGRIGYADFGAGEWA